MSAEEREATQEQSHNLQEELSFQKISEFR